MTQQLDAAQQVCGRQLQVTWQCERDGLCSQMGRSEPRLVAGASQQLDSQLLLSSSTITQHTQ